MKTTEEDFSAAEEHISTAELAQQMPGNRADVPGNGADVNEASGPLLPQDSVQDFRTHWDKIQTGFVDEPRNAVQAADELVAQAIKRLAESFAEERNRLGRQWERGDAVNTEDLRVALRKYRSFFQRLLSV
jgi:hypothetical protein